MPIDFPTSLRLALAPCLMLTFLLTFSVNALALDDIPEPPATQPADGEPLLEAVMSVFEPEVTVGEPVHLVVVVMNRGEKAVNLPGLDLAPWSSREPQASDGEEGHDHAILDEMIAGGSPPSNASIVLVGRAEARVERVMEAAQIQVAYAPLGPNDVRLYLITLNTGGQMEDQLDQALEMRAAPPGVTIEEAGASLGTAGESGDYEIYLKFDSDGIPEPGVEYTDQAERLDVPRVRFETNHITLTLTEPEAGE